MLHLLLGRSGTGKTEQILRSMAASGGGHRQVLLVPEPYSHDMERMLCAVGGNRTANYAEVLSFTRLANRVFSTAGGLAAPVLDPGGRVLMMYAAVKSVADKLTVYQRPGRRPAFLTGLLATVDELKTCRISSADLWRAWEETGGEEAGKLRDLSLIYGAYEAMTAREAADPRDRITRLAEGLDRCRWASDKDIYVDGFSDFSAQEREVLLRLMKQAHSVTVALTCGALDGEERVFAYARRTARRLVAAAKKEGVSVSLHEAEGPERPRSPALRAVEAALAERPIPGAEWEGIRLYRAKTPYSELEWVAAEILRLVREEGLRFRDIAVAGRSLDGREETLTLLFRRYGVPAFFSAMSDVLQRPVFAVVTAALDTVTGGYRYEDVFRYLKTGLTGMADEDRDLLENYVLKWNLRGSRWTEARPWTMHPKGYGLPMTEGDRALVERLDNLRRQVAAPLERLRKAGPGTGRDWSAALYAFLWEISLPETLARRGEELRQSGRPALADEYGQLWDIFCQALEQCALLLGETELELDEYAKLLSLALSQYDVGTIPVSLDRVQVGNLTRMAHNKSYRALFLIGADDTAIPKAAAEPGLLNDDDRSLLTSLGLEMGQNRDERMDHELSMIYETCAIPTQRLTISWSAAGSGGEEQRPCYLVGRLRDVFPGLDVLREEETGGSFRLAAPNPALELAGRDERVAEVLGQLPGCRDRVERLRRARDMERGAMSRGAVDALYGKKIPLSASRMDLFRSCHFSYFLRYGLRAEARRPAGFQAPEYGTFVHYVLEHVLKEKEAWAAPEGYDRSKLRAVTQVAIRRYVDEELGGLEGETPRFQYLFKRLRRAVYAVVDNVAQELARSQFQPIAFELGIGETGGAAPVNLTVDGLTLSLSGFVDRVDSWEHDGRLYVRVVDYKTGRKSFDLTDVWNGLGLQMLLYLFTLKDRGEEYFRRQAVPAGVLYLPARDAVIAGSRGMSEEERQQAVDKELQRRGLVLDDPEVLAAMEDMEDGRARFLPVRISAKTGAVTGDVLVSAEQLGRLERHVRQVLEEIGGEFARGVIDADPFWKGPERNACQWCDYAQACQFEEGRGGDRRRWLPTVRNEEFWRRLEEREKTDP